MKQQLIKKYEKYHNDPEFKRRCLEASKIRYELKKKQIYLRQKLYHQLKRDKINQKRKERYWKQPEERRKAKLLFLKENRERKKNNGFSDLELKHIAHFMKPYDNIISNRIFILVHGRARNYTPSNRYGIPTSSFR